MDAPIEIVDFDTQDIAPANALTNRYILETPIHFGYTAASEADFARLWSAGRDRFPWLAARIGGEFAGYAKAATWRERDAYRFTAETAVYVTDQFQRRGVARALYAELLKRLKEQGIKVAVAGITIPNDPSIRLHEAMGFRKVGQFERCGLKFDRWWDVGFWQIDL